MGSTTKVIIFLVWLIALLGAPTLMFLGYNLLGGLAAGNLGIYDFRSDYLEGVIIALLLLGIILFVPIRQSDRRALALLWLVRMGISLGAMLAFEIRYRGDFNIYYNGGQALNDPLAHFEFGNGTANMQTLVALLSQLIDGYNGIKVIFSFLGLAAIYIFYRAAVMCIGQERIVLLYVLGAVPSLLLWSSLLGKEPVVLLGIAIFCYGAAGFFALRKPSMLLYVAIGLAIAAAIRIWLAPIFIAPMILAFAMTSRTHPLGKLAFLIVAVPAFLLALQTFAGQFRLETVRDLVATTEALSTQWAVGGSAQVIEGGFGSLREMIAFIPIGAFTALFRPLPFEVMNMFGLLAGLENALLLSLVLLGLMRRGIGWMSHPILLWVATTLFVWATVYGFVSYQNLGTAFRWRSQVTPMLLLFGLYLTFAHHLRDEVRGRLKRRPKLASAASQPVAEGG